MGRVYLQVDGLAVNALVVAGNAGRLALDLPLHVGKVPEASMRDVVEFSPFILPRDARGSMRDVDVVVIGLVGPLAGDIDQLQDKRPARDDAAAARQEIASNDILENR